MADGVLVGLGVVDVGLPDGGNCFAPLRRGRRLWESSAALSGRS